MLLLRLITLVLPPALIDAVLVATAWPRDVQAVVWGSFGVYVLAVAVGGMVVPWVRPQAGRFSGPYWQVVWGTAALVYVAKLAWLAWLAVRL